MTKNIDGQEIPLSWIGLENGISAGIHIRLLGSDVVSPQEEHESRLERGIRLKEWEGMDEVEKALIIAVRRNQIAIRNQNEEAQAKHTEQEMRRK